MATRLLGHNDATATPLPQVRPSGGARYCLYVDTTGAVVRRRGRHFQVDHHTPEGTQTHTRVPISDVDSMALVGDVHCTMPAVRHCLHEEIRIVLLSWNGRVEGQLAPGSTAHTERRLAQYRAYCAPERRLQLACTIVRSKLLGMQHRLRGRARRCSAPAVSEAVARIRSLLREMDGVSRHDQLLGIEGAASNAYFGVWDDLIAPPQLRFQKRSRRPPQNGVNALLGFCYALMQADVHAGCVMAGLDPALGVLHTPQNRRPAMVLDLMEAFRPALADALVLSLVNRREIRPEHFESRDGGVFLNEVGRKVLYRGYGRARAREITPHGYPRALPYYRVMELQARRFAQAILKDTPFQGFRMG